MVITGSMFSGKTEELIRTLRRFIIAKQKTILFKPSIDDRYDKEKVVSHNGDGLNAIVISQIKEITDYVDNNEDDIVGSDEAQFLAVDELRYLAIELARQGKKVIIAVLDKTSAGPCFKGIPELLAEADVLKKLHAICIECGGLASHSFRLSGSEKVIDVGGSDKYIALCRGCWSKKSKKT